jgi:PAS domain S-box-containing protein
MSEFKLSNDIKITIPWRLIVIFLLFSFIIILIGINYYKVRKDRDFREQENKLSAIATLKIREIINWHRERIGDASTLKDNKPLIRVINQFFRDPNNLEIRGDITRWIESEYKYYDYSGVLLIDTLLKVRLSVIPSDTIAGDAISTELHDVLRNNMIIMTDLHRAKCISNVHLDLIIPLTLSGPRENKSFGMIILRINPEKILFPLIKAWPTPSRSSETLLLRREGDSIVYLNDLRYQSNTALKLKMPLSNRNLLAAIAGKGFEGISEGIDYRNIPVVGYLSHVPDLPWYMVAKIDKEEIEEPLKNQIYIAVLGTILLILINASIFGFWIWDQQVRLYRKQLKVEAKARESEEKLRLKNLVFNASIAANSISDINGIITEVNDAFLKAWGYPHKDHAIGKAISEFMIYPDEGALIVKALLKYGEWEGDYTARKMDGSSFIAHGLATIIRDDTGNTIGYQSSVLDVTEWKNQEVEIRILNEELEKKVISRTEQLETANKELESFSYSVSHDLRAPLRAVHSYTNILLEEYENKLDEDGKRLCRIISSSAIQMGCLIDDLLSFSRIGRSTLNPAKLEMKSIAKAGFEEALQESRNKEINITIDKLHQVKGDPGLIKLVWNNLISNAIKYTSKKKKPEIIIGSAQVNGMINYFIRDNGVGFDMQYNHKLFGVFQRLHSEREFEGNGVGLAIVQRIIQKHNGKVWAESEVGKGATFYFSLPANGAEEKEIPGARVKGTKGKNDDRSE